ncbi:histidine phosphatase family protein [Candidatus Kaiserbacteria bacterium]|nr:histidine phosphatase family protein [Candidatus Kaiserbacteria bacterium]
MTNSTLFLFVRHGQAEGNVSDLVLGTQESPLTDLGRKQALERTTAIKHLNLIAVYSSDLNRALETATIIGNEVRVVPIIDRLLRERFVGDALQGRTNEEVKLLLTDEYQRLQGMRLADQLDYRYSMAPDAETPREAVDRLLLFMTKRSLQYHDSDGPIVCVTHGAILGNFLALFGKIRFEGIFGAAAIGNAEVCAVTFDRSTNEIVDITLNLS